jgi:F0F1-type ATP synthase membrane subunit b/b'
VNRYKIAEFSEVLKMLQKVKDILEAISLSPLDGVMILVCTLLIAILYKLLAVKVFNPLLEHVERRESLTSGAVHTAAQMRQKTVALRSRFDEAIFKARVEGNAKRAEIVAAAKKSAHEIIRAAEEDASNELIAGRQEIARKIAAANSGADTEVQNIATQLVTQVDSHLAG